MSNVETIRDALNRMGTRQAFGGLVTGTHHALPAALDALDGLAAENRRLRKALGGLDEPVQWIAENYPAVWWAMPSEFYRRFSEVRAALTH